MIIISSLFSIFRMKLPDLLWCQRVETVGWDYENWLQQEYGLEDEVVEEAEEEIEEVEIDVSNLKPGVNLLKVKIADWKDNDHYAILGLQDIRYKERYHTFLRTNVTDIGWIQMLFLRFLKSSNFGISTISSDSSSKMSL